MATHRLTFSLTTDTNGYAVGDANLKLPTSPERHYQLLGISVDRSSAKAGSPAVCLSELNDVSAETWNSTSEDYALGDQLFYSDAVRASGQVLTVTSLDSVVDARDVTLTSAITGGGIMFIRKRRVRCEVFNGGSAQSYTVAVYYETPGDLRF